MSQSRQLAAIMFTDIVGYTALMGKDEKKAFALLRRNREIQKPLVKYYSGIWIKELGDGVLASFHTVTDAVFCAAAIHQACNNVEGLKLRVGIHLGEVIFENNDVFGDGVNIASRLQAMASPGSTWVSEAVYKNLVNKKEISSEFVKEEFLKNVSEPVKVYEISVREIPGYLPGDIKSYQRLARGSQTVKSKKAIYITAIIVLAGFIASYFLFFGGRFKSAPTNESSTEKSIAVLPFVNISDDPKQEYFSDGLTEELIDMFTRIPGLQVTGRTTSFAYKGKNADLRTIGKTLGVDYLLAGSVRKSGNKIRITVQLVKASNGMHLWSESFDKEMDNILEVQDQISASVRDALKVTLLNKDTYAAKRKINPEAYNDFLKGRYHYERRYSPGYNENAITWFKEAIKKDSTFSLPWAYLSMCYWRQASNAVQPEFIEAKRAALKALSLEPGSAIALVNVSVIEDGEYNFSDALKKMKTALELEPENPYVLRNACRLYSILGKHDTSVLYGKKALEKDPIQNVAMYYLARAYFFSGNDKEAANIIRKLKSLPDHSANREYSEILIKENNLDEAFKEAQKEMEAALQLFEYAVFYSKSKNKTETENALQHLTENYFKQPYLVALAYAETDNPEKALDWLEKSFAVKSKELVFINAEPAFKGLSGSERFQRLIHQMKFP